MKIYTKTGDEGLTGVLGSQRLRKDDARIEAYGTVDELNAVLGVARAEGLDASADALAARLQDDLFNVGAALADPDPEGPVPQPDRRRPRRAAGIGDRRPGRRGRAAAEASSCPAAAVAAAQLHLARTVCRRAERLVVHLAHQPGEHVPSALDRLPEPTQRPFVRAGPRRQPPGGGRRHPLEAQANDDQPIKPKAPRSS